MPDGEGTAAVLDAPPAAPSVEAPPPSAPETVSLEAPETSIGTAPDSATTAASPFEGKTDEEIAALPEVDKILKDRIARVEESNRRKAENERSAAIAQARMDSAVRVRQGHAWRELSRLVTDAMNNGAETVDGQGFNVVLSQLDAYATTSALQHIVEDDNQVLERDFPGWVVPGPLTEAYAQAAARNDLQKLAQARRDIWEQAVLDKKLAAKEAELERKFAERVKAEATASSTQAGTAARQAQGGPTNVATGAAARAITTEAEANRAYNAGEISHEQYRTLRTQFGVGAEPGGR